VRGPRGIVASGALAASVLAALAPARGKEPETPPAVYAALFDVAIVPSERAARVTIRLGDGADHVEWMRFRIDPERHRSFQGDGEIRIDDGSVEWRPPPNGGALRYDFRIDQLRDERSYDARCARRWAIFRGDDLVPPARVRTDPIAHSRSRLRLRLPEGWSAAVPYARVTGGEYRIRHEGRRFDRPIGWFAVGDLGVLREQIEGVSLSVAGPTKHGLRRLDIVALLTWSMPTLAGIFGDLPGRLLVVGAGDPMWRGGLSGPNSLFIHAGRPLIEEDGTSPLLHEMVHTLLGVAPGSGGDWIVEGLAERYSLEVLRRSGTLTAARYEAALARLRERAKRGGKLRVHAVDGDTRARAVVVMHELDAEIRAATADAKNLDDVLRALRQERKDITTSRFQALVEAVAGRSFEDFFQRHAPSPAGR